jgi:23S rRNA (guanosine2251-2'-O)-methyltransferase
MKKNKKIYGIHTVNEFFKTSPHRVLNILIQESIRSKLIENICETAKKHKLPIKVLKKDQLNKMVNSENHQGIVIEIKEKSRDSTNQLETILKSNMDIQPIYLILDSIQDPHNLGACIRSAVAANVSAIIIPKNRAATVNETVKKVACGAAENLTIVTVVNLVRAIKKMKEAGVWVIGAAVNTKKSIYDIDMTAAIAVIIGNEEKGIRLSIKKECDYVGSLPISDKVQSLNASVAAGIILFEAVRQRREK